MGAILSIALVVAVVVGASSCGAPRDEAPSDQGSTSSPPRDPHAALDGGVTLDAGADHHHGAGSTRCSACHKDEDRTKDKWRETAKRIGHDVDAALADRTRCTCCHLGEVKGFGDPLDRRCLSCHDDKKVTITAMGSMHCVSCHDPAKLGGAAIREGAWECQKCHAGAQGARAGIDVHRGEDCASCHRPHEEPWTMPMRCADCHPGRETGHGKAPSQIAEHAGVVGTPCDTCHKPHETAGAASHRCEECHNKDKPGAFAKATFEAGHAACTSCHEPHAGDRAPPKACTTCHDHMTLMNVRGKAGAFDAFAGRALSAVPKGEAAHQDCASCHKPHDVKGTAAASCAGCHAGVHPDHPDPKGVGCVGCHAPHPKAGGGSRATCNTCHTAAKNESAFHTGGLTCASCHAPHTFTKASAKPCASCHEKVSATASHGGHKDCGGCHTAHTPVASKPSCERCHEAEKKTAPLGHSECASCHAVHSGSAAPKAACASCHAPKKTGPHARQDCGSCHRAHGPDAPRGPIGPASPPACTSCHATQKLGGLHQKPSHGTCTSCHTAHGSPSAERASCVGACHADKKDHEPTAKVCKGCHAFGKGR